MNEMKILLQRPV